MKTWMWRGKRRPYETPFDPRLIYDHEGYRWAHAEARKILRDRTYPGLDDYILDSLSSYRDMTWKELSQAIHDSYGSVGEHELYRRINSLLTRKLVQRVVFGVYRRVRAIQTDRDESPIRATGSNGRR